MTYVGKGYASLRDGHKQWLSIKNATQCLDLCKEKYLEDNLWNGCAYSTYGPIYEKCVAYKNERGFKANSRFGFS